MQINLHRNFLGVLDGKTALEGELKLGLKLHYKLFTDSLKRPTNSFPKNPCAQIIIITYNGRIMF